MHPLGPSTIAVHVLEPKTALSMYLKCSLQILTLPTCKDEKTLEMHFKYKNRPSRV